MSISRASNFEKYLELYKRDQTSKVFAPLADIYRKMGMIEESIKILKEGLKYHPQYALGYINLALCYLELGKTTIAYDTLKTVVDQNLDNIILLRNYSDICVELDKNDEAKFYLEKLLFLVPKDKITKQKILEITKNGQRVAPLKIKLQKTSDMADQSIDYWDSVQNYQITATESTASFDRVKAKEDIYKKFLKKIQTRSFSA